MKKFMSLFLALVMVCSLSVSVFAAFVPGIHNCEVCGTATAICPNEHCTSSEANYCPSCDLCEVCGYTSTSSGSGGSGGSGTTTPSSGNETVITYTGAGTEAYTITVPSTLEPDQSGTVKAQGTWATNRTLKVTTADTVTVTNSIDGGEKVLDVTFAGIDQAGDNTTSITVSKTISVGDISNALFGTWTGVITYNVSMEDAVTAPTLISFTIEGTSYQAEEGMTWAEWVDSDYNKDGYKLGILGTDFATIGCNSFSHHSTDNVIATASSHYGDSNIVGKRIETTGLTEVDQAEVIVAMNYELGVCGD